MSDHLTSPNFGGLSEFATDPTKVDKPWGYELIWALTDDYCGKILCVRAGESLSLQYHRIKDETIYLHEGLAEIDLGNDEDHVTVLSNPGVAYRIRPGVVHRLRALQDSLFLEVSTPHLDDVVRIEDLYGRQGG